MANILKSHLCNTMVACLMLTAFTSAVILPAPAYALTLNEINFCIKIEKIYEKVKKAIDRGETNKRTKKEELASIICELCTWQPLTAQQLADLLNRKDKKYLVRQHLSPLVKKGALKHVYPERGTSPNQAYTAH